MKKKPTPYIIIIIAWLCCSSFLGYTLAFVIRDVLEDVSHNYDLTRKIIIITLLSFNTLCLTIIIFGSIKDFVFSMAYAIMHKKLYKRYEEVNEFSQIPEPAPKFLLLYCTCNDFNEEALLESSQQDYTNYNTIILDDSKDPEYIHKIDEFCKAHPEMTLVRRTDRTGYKAGNLNNYLKGRTDYDYFVVLDSDEVIPHDYITKTIKYFNYNPKCGAVQVRHEAKRGENVFQRLLGMCVASNGRTVQVVKNFYGSNALIGHGMTISRACYEATGGFPLVVAEDISFAVEIRNAGMEIIYAPDILCYEEFPVNYASLKKRQCKWTQGNLEYMRKYGKDINHSKMKWYEKLDIKLSHYSLPIVPVLSFLLACCSIALGFCGYPIIRYSLGVFAMLLVFLCSPLLPDLFVYHKGRNLLLLIPYFIVNIATYASLAPMMLKTVFLGLCGKKAVFLITPKKSYKLSFWEIIKYTWDSLLFALILGVLSYIACKSVIPVMLLMVSCFLAPFITALANISLKKNKKATAA